MVDAISGRTTGGAVPVARVVATPAPVAVRADTRTTGDTATLGGIARALAASPPVDTDRVTRIRRAIEEGKFPISPTTIADRLLALRLDWTSQGPAGKDQA